VDQREHPAARRRPADPAGQMDRRLDQRFQAQPGNQRGDQQ
jgi:hypothetical protein